jgi:hypothetical protein
MSKWRTPKHQCPCGRRAIFQSPHGVKADHHHSLCPRCYRAAFTRLTVGHEARVARGLRPNRLAAGN